VGERLSDAITIRRLHETDADLAGIVDQINDAPMETGPRFTVASLRNFLADPKNVYLVATIEGRLAGALHAVRYLHPSGPWYLYIDEVDTAEPFRRQGVATRLMMSVMAIARDMGISEAWLGADDGNEAAHALYRRLHPSETEPGVIYTYRV